MSFICFLKGRIRAAKERAMLTQHQMATHSSQRTSSHDAGCPWAHVHRRTLREKAGKVRCRGRGKTSRWQNTPGFFVLFISMSSRAFCLSSSKILRTLEAARNALKIWKTDLLLLILLLFSVSSSQGTALHIRKYMPGVLSEELK